MRLEVYICTTCSIIVLFLYLMTDDIFVFSYRHYSSVIGSSHSSGDKDSCLLGHISHWLLNSFHHFEGAVQVCLDCFSL